MPCKQRRFQKKTNLLVIDSNASRLHLCPDRPCLLIHQGGKGRLASQTRGPSSYPLPAVGQVGGGADPFKDAWGPLSRALSSGELCVALMKYSWPLCCVQCLAHGASHVL